MLRCPWPGVDPDYVAYHDREWGVPEHRDQALFEKIILDGFQAGLSWITILRKRENFRRAFDGFDPELIARYGKKEIEKLMADAGIVRNRAKIEGAVKSARAYLEIVDKHGDFDRFVWQATSGETIQNRWKTTKDLPAESAESLALSKLLKGRGFSFVGPTIVYAYMQAIGMVNDHLLSCFRHAELGGRSTRGPRVR